MSESYRQRFVKTEDAANYDAVVYAPGTASDLLWRLETEVLEQIVGDFRRSRGHIDYLDFACGTGRVISFLADKVDTAVGIDISQAMLDSAREKVGGATLICKDITSPEDEIEGRYDIITAFRFLLNAEPSLRQAALRGLVLRLKSQDSLLLVNTHGNPFSYKAALLPYHWLRAVLRSRKLGGYMMPLTARTELTKAGLVIEQVIGMGFVGEKLFRVLPWSFCMRVERLLTGNRAMRPFALNHLYVCRKGEAGTHE